MKFTIESKYEIGDLLKVNRGLTRHNNGVVVTIELFQLIGCLQVRYLVEFKTKERLWFTELDIIELLDDAENEKGGNNDE